jgi:polysaccharide biosynthesis/export protein
MKPSVLFACLISLCGCAWLPRAGPSASDVVEQGQAGGEILFDVVDVDAQVVSTLLAQPKESFRAHFKSDAQPPDVKIAIGDTIVVLIWESAAGGLFSETPPGLPTSGSRPTTEPLAPDSRPPTVQRPGDFGPPTLSTRQPPEAARPRENQPPSGGTPARDAFAIESNAATAGRQAANIPDQQVGPDGAISIPYAGRIPAAARSAAEVQQTIEAQLAQKALEPQALVIVKKSAVNAVTVAGEVVAGARVSLSPGGDRLLQVIAAAGGARAPVHETFVRLSRDGDTATIPLERLVADPAEDIYAQPGDVLTLVRMPQTFSVFGAAGRNAAITFDAENITLSEALAKSQGLRDDLANPQGVFLFRYEPNPLVRALAQPIATRAQNGSSPIAYRFNLKDGKSYFFADQFPVRDKDIVFVADAPADQVQKLFTALAQITGPVITGLLVCRQTAC